jgi:hypothetical protein
MKPFTLPPRTRHDRHTETVRRSGKVSVSPQIGSHCLHKRSDTSLLQTRSHATSKKSGSATRLNTSSTGGNDPRRPIGAALCGSPVPAVRAPSGPLRSARRYSPTTSWRRLQQAMRLSRIPPGQRRQGAAPDCSHVHW